MASTLLLDRTNWDLALDASGNIAVATEPYSIVQDVASACRLFLGEAYYDTSRGIRYFQQILGRPVRRALVKSQLRRAALSVPGVLTATVYLTSLTERNLSGQVQITTAQGAFTVTV